MTESDSAAPPIRRMLKFIAGIMTMWTAAHLYLIGLALWALDRTDLAIPVVPVALLVSTVLLLFVLIARMAGHPLVRGLRTPVLAYAGSASVVFMAVLVSHPISAIVGWVSTPEYARWVVLAGFALGLGTAAAALLGGLRKAKIIEVDIPVPDLHPDLDGYRIVMLSDVHIGAPTRRREFEQVVDIALSLNADMFAFVGDLVDGSVAALRDEVAPIARLKARDGAFFVTGNHEYYSNAKPWEREVERLGLRVLSNEHDRVQVGDATLVVAGISDTSAGQFVPADASDPATALANTADADFRLLLAHQPALIDAATDAGADLQLSGHTHGGQFVPWTWLVGFFNPYSKGLAKHRDRTWIYVSCGSATWGPPMRLGAPTEVTALTLRTASHTSNELN